MFFESRVADTLQIARNASHLYPAHFHLDLEIFMLKAGDLSLTLNGKSFPVKSGDIVVVDSYDVHSYDKNESQGERNSCVLIIPYRYLEKFNSRRKYFKIKNALLHEPELCNRLISIVDEYVNSDCSDSVKEAGIEMILALLSEKLVFTDEKGNEDGVLIRSILAYVQENYRGEISLDKIAKHLGYSSAHVSRSFHKYIQMGLSEYVNRLRMDYVAQEKAKDGKRKMVDLIYEAGFKSQQTYYRCKKNER